ISDTQGLANYTIYLFNITGLYNITSILTPDNPLFINIGILISMVDGVYEWFYSAFDFTGNEVISENRTITIDSHSPNIYYGIGTEVDAANLTVKNIIVNITAEDIILSNITINLYNNLQIINQSVTVSTSENYYNFNVYQDGIYYFNATACDSLNQCNS